MLYTNKGNGRFEESKILQFPAVYGSTYFELDDFNHDGFPDILYTCGDNADYSPILKPNHGVYIFLNDGKNHFRQRYFFPMHGCFKAMARDFDGDGDLDIAAISFFPDFKHAPEESFFYLENKGEFNFQPYTIPQAAEGRWLTMDVGNFYGSGKPDTILGNFNYGLSTNNSSSHHQASFPFIVLKNTIKRVH
jgi:FG-GAP-like repeat